jgi:hypothetical protein
MSDVLLKQLDAVDVQIDLLKVMVAGIRQVLSAPRAQAPDKLPTCAGIDDEDCGRLYPEAIHHLGKGETQQRMCRGCGRDPVTGLTAK